MITEVDELAGRLLASIEKLNLKFLEKYESDALGLLIMSFEH